jgi:hypothetical protein
MKHYDYDWDLYPNMIKLDDELNTDALGWKHGDLFKFVNVDGQQIFKKVDPSEKFLHEGLNNE